MEIEYNMSQALLTLPKILLITILLLIAFIALSTKKHQGRIGLYLMLSLPLTLCLEYFGYPFSEIPLIIILVGAPPFHNWLIDLYSNYKFTGILLGFVAITYLYLNQTCYSSIAPLMILFGVWMMIGGILQGMICKAIPQFFMSIHQIVFGILFITSIISELRLLFFYLLIPSILSLLTINYIYNSTSKKPNESLHELDGLSNVIGTDNASTLIAYLIIFSLVSFSAEIFMQMGVKGNSEFIALGSITVFIAAGSLAVFFRNYALVFEGLSKNNTNSGGLQKFALILSSSLSILFSLAPVWSLSLFSFVYEVQPSEFESLNILLLIALLSVFISLVVAKSIKTGKIKSWTTGYTSIEDISSKGEVFTLWGEIFKPFYNYKIPDDKISSSLERTNPIILLAIFISLAIIGVLI